MISYTDILKAIHLLLDEGLSEVTVEISPALQWDTQFVGIELESQENKEANIGRPTPYQATLEVSVMVAEFSPDGVVDSLERRDALVGRVFDLLHSNRTLGGLVGATQVGDFKFETARTEAGFNAAAIIPLRIMLIS
jgi:hypothetical protein